SMAGGSGDDRYEVDNVGDVVTQDADEGTDTVIASVAFVLGANIENLTLTGTLHIARTGNDLGNVITGNAGQNRLQGLGGADILDGGAGRVIVSYVASTAGVTVSLLTGLGSGGDAEGDVLVAIEDLIGSAFDDTFEGDGGPNALAAGAGIDTVSY